jgi:ribonuclease HII
MSGLAATACATTTGRATDPSRATNGASVGTKRARFEESDDIPVSVGKYSAVGEMERAYRGTVQAVYFPPAMRVPTRVPVATAAAAATSTGTSTGSTKKVSAAKKQTEAAASGNARKPIPLKSAPKEIEQGFLDQGYEYVVGVDEAGMGSLCGPVTVCACITPIDVITGGVRDSKSFNTPSLVKRRDSIYDILQSDQRIHKAIVYMDHQYVDKHNVQVAGLDGMTRAVDTLLEECPVPDGSRIKIIIDGNKAPKSLMDRYDCLLLPKADVLTYCTGAASIFAKVSRDRYMEKVLHPLFPEYGWDTNHGYPRQDHMTLVRNLGYSAFHRISFNPCNKVQMSEHSKEWLATGHNVDDYAPPD